jgi:hypothetical protein
MKKALLLASLASLGSVASAYLQLNVQNPAAPFAFQWFEPSSSMWMQGGFGNGTLSPTINPDFGKDFFYQGSAWYRGRKTGTGGQPREYQVSNFYETKQTSPSSGYAKAFETVDGVGNVIDVTYEFILRSMGPNKGVVTCNWTVRNNKTDQYQIDFFPYIDLQTDPAPFSDSVSYNAAKSMFTYSSSVSNRPTLNVKAMGQPVVSYESAYYFTLRGKLSNTTKDVQLASTVPSPFIEDDLATAFHHILQIPGLQSKSGSYAVGINVEPGTLITASGEAQLTNFLGDTTKVPVTLEVLEQGTDTIVESISTYVDGVDLYSTTLMSRGTYDIGIRASHWLRSRIQGVTIAEGIPLALDQVSLVNGDVNGDNSIDLLDYFRLSDAYNTEKLGPGFDPNADLNGDDSVDLLDYFVLSDNYNLVGE